MSEYSMDLGGSPKILQAFFQKPQSEVDHAIEEYSSRRRQSARSRWRYLRLGQTSKRVSPEMVAESYHRRMVEGSHVCHVDWIDEDLALIAATLPAQQIAELSCEVACESGKLSEIHQKMIKIDRTHGLALDEVWEVDSMPREYRMLVDRSHAILNRIFETVFVQVLERYHLGWIVELFEKRRIDFEIRYEVGRRLLDPSSAGDISGNELVAANLRDQFGDRTVQRLKSRLAAHGLS